METLQNLAGGLAGAVALNIVHETVRKFDNDAPKIQLVGEEALSKTLSAVGIDPLKGQNLYLATLAGDIFSNTIYYSAIGNAKNKHLLIRGLGFGIAAGLGALNLTKPIGLNDEPITKTNKTKILTVAWYALGGVVAALAIKALRK